MVAACPFCAVPPERIVWESPLVVAIRDLYPVGEGHTLVLTRRHRETYFDASAEEQAEIWRAVKEIKAGIDVAHSPQGYNVGFNVGAAGGQTVMHLHVHVIPRYEGDMEDPRGGVRHVIPNKGNYLAGGHGDISLTDGRDTRLQDSLLQDLDQAVRADLAVAFVLPSGLRGDVLPRLRDILRRPGSRVRILTGDYQDVTPPEVLYELLRLQEEVHTFQGASEDDSDRDPYQGEVQLRVFETQRAGRSFHPKAYLLYGDAHGQALAAYVGSSNLTRTALAHGVEWNLRLSQAAQRRAALQEHFEALFADPHTAPLTADWIRAYEYRRKPPQPGAAPAGNQDPEPLPETAVDVEQIEVPEPNDVQQQALERLQATRDAGNRAGLVVLATGLGKTWLAAFDSTPQRGFQSVLFVAHRDEILRQAASTFARIRPGARLGFYTGTQKDEGADVLFASIQTLGRQAHLDRFDASAFDYIVVDEFHHASAATYRRLLAHFSPEFLLGLTATPERSDGGDLLGLCQQNLVCNFGLAGGIERGLLSPFHYHGIADMAEYPNIPWRSLDEETLTNAVATHARARNAFEQWQKHGGERTVGFCVSRRHADFMRECFREYGVERVASVHSGDGSDPRTGSLQALERGRLDVLFCVDMFNEGVDVPHIDTVLMLRPTESKIIWLQQLGRGLRYVEGKTLQVIDYIGNHKVFIRKPEALLQALGIELRTSQEVLVALREARHQEALPPGCEVTYELEAIDILEQLYPASRGAERIRLWYEQFRELNERRPTALEAYQSGFNPKALRRSYGSWFGFVSAMGDLTDAQRKVFESDADFLAFAEQTVLNRSYKLVVLLALDLRGQLPGTLSLPDLAGAFAHIARRSRLLTDDLAVDLDDPEEVEKRLVKYPCDRLSQPPSRGAAPFFSLSNGIFGTTNRVKAGPDSPLPELVTELVDWRLAEYLDRRRAPVTFRIIQNSSGNPIVKIDRKLRDLPEGWADIRINGVPYQAKFAKEFVNVLRAADAPREDGPNMLPEVLRSYYGSDVGAPGGRSELEHTATTSGTIEWRLMAPPPAFVDDEGNPVDATFTVEKRDDILTVLFDSRGAGRNNEYNRGLQLLLQRLGAAGLELRDVLVESGKTRTLEAVRRSVETVDYPYPIQLSEVDDLADLQRSLGRAQASVGRKPGAKGAGNSTKRIRLVLVATDASEDQWFRRLATGRL